jgi:D-alanyl-D-alanine carboxypeptidase
LSQGEKAGSVEAFVNQMNQRAQELGLQKTHFQNVTGLDHPEQYSSAHDIGYLVDTFLQTPFFSQTVRQQVTTIREQTTGRQDTIYTTNAMLYRGSQFTGVKTGTTEMAGQSLVLRLQDTWSIPEATSGGQLHDTPVDIIFVFLGSQDRYIDAQNLSEWLERAIRLRENSVS